MTDRLASLQASGHLRRVDAALGTWLLRAFPGADNAALAAALAARAVAAGHSALPLTRAQAWLDGLDGDAAPLRLPDAAAWRAALTQSPAVATSDAAPTAVAPLVLDPDGRLYLRRYFEYERTLANALVTRASHTEATSAAIEPGDSDPAQHRAILAALAHRLVLVTGGPGTGKTHSVVQMLRALAAQTVAHGTSLRIALAAPTGKAAARLVEAVQGQLAHAPVPAAVAAQIPATATTVHRLLGLAPASPHPRFDHAQPLPFDVVVVDEVSMVDLPLMAKLVDAVAPAARLILLGDPGQLAAVEAGNVLGALVTAACAAPLAACHVALTRSHRFGADSGLGTLARAIAAGDADAALAAGTDSPAIAWCEPAQRGAFLDAAATIYQRVTVAADAAAALAAAREFRVLTALRHGPAGCVALDRALALRLKRAAGVAADTRWWRGRLLLVTANRPELGLFNGDTGVVWPDAHGAPRVWFETASGMPRAFAPAVLPPHEGAFALTVHKAQGSEFDRVALVTGPDSAALTRQLLYTGVTRARSHVELCADPAVLRAGILRSAERFGGLAARIAEAAAATSAG